MQYQPKTVTLTPLGCTITSLWLSCLFGGPYVVRHIHQAVFRDGEYMESSSEDVSLECTNICFMSYRYGTLACQSHFNILL